MPGLMIRGICGKNQINAKKSKDARPRQAGVTGVGMDAGLRQAGVTGVGMDAGLRQAGVTGVGMDAGPKASQR